jgi:class 3 adenylate cyclase
MARQGTWTWHFDPPPAVMWPLLADTARFNEAAGLPHYSVTETPAADGTVTFEGKAKIGPFAVSWREVPVDLVQGRWFRQTRLFNNGPFKRMTASLDLTAEGSGSLGRYRLEVEPRNLAGTAALLAGFFRSSERGFTKVASRVHDFARGTASMPFVAEKVKLSDEARGRLTRATADMRRDGADPDITERLAAYVREALEADLRRMRPLALARAWGKSERLVIEACLIGVRADLLSMHWDLLCSNCRGAKRSAASLDRLPKGAHCDTCNIDYERDFTRNVELTFRPVPAIRDLTGGEFCAYGPMQTPHVLIQQNLEPGETRDVEASLEAGDYRARTFFPGGDTIFAVNGAAPTIVCGDGGIDTAAPANAGVVRFVNQRTQPVTLVVESREWVKDALTADRVTAMQAFRELFATEALRPGDDVAIGRVTLMFTDLRGSTALYSRIGDAAAYRLVREHFAFLADQVREHDGGIVKTIGDAVMAAFPDPAQAVRAALAVQRSVARFNQDHGLAEGLVIKLGLHSGSAIAVTLNDRLDYFGSTVNLAARLQGQSRGGDIVLSEALAGDPAVAALIADLQCAAEEAPIKGFERPVAFRRLEVRAESRTTPHS